MYVKRFVTIIIAILLMALVFQAVRSLLVARLIKNRNEPEILPDPRSITVPDSARNEHFLIVFNGKEDNSLKITENLQKSLDYMKKQYSIYDVEKTPLPQKYALNFDCVILTFERLDLLADHLKEYIDYVSGGGKILFLTRPVIDKSFKEISNLLGIKTFSEKLVNERGIKLLSDILIGAQGFKTRSESIKNSSIRLTLDNDSKIHLTCYDGNPLLWEREYGSGKFIVFNGTMLNEKLNRGMIPGIISLACGDFVYPVLNIKMLHIDDFPAPIPRRRDEKIYEEFGRSIPQFYQEVWWPDIVKLLKRYDLKISCFVIESYNNDVEPPFKKPDKFQTQNLLLYGKEVLGIGGEIGLHGYNHQPLVPSGYVKQDLNYTPWRGKDDMRASIKELISYIHSIFNNYTLRAYVPPSNILSPEGRAAVIEANPDLEIIASVYLPNLEGDVYSQEFEVSGDGIIEFPRLSAGYEKTDEIMWQIYNGANMPGVFAHFIHPDDILDERRNKGKSWTILYEEFSSILSEVDSKFGWLRSRTISEASAELVKFLEFKPNIEYSENEIKIYCENFREDSYCILRTSKDVTKSVNCNYVRISKSAYLITIKDAYCSLTLE
ncbi:MAG: DUF2194 domain-containing protein [Actinobacteria bacterium]|nr:DUF2194 domain-containing protein [Actinomycetota bacterium]